MKGIPSEHSPSSFDPCNNKEKSELHSHISDYNEQYECDLHAQMFLLLIFFRKINISVWYVNSTGRHQWLCK